VVSEQRLSNAEYAIRNLEREVAVLTASNREWHESVLDQLDAIDAKLNPIVTMIAEYRGGARVVRVLFWGMWAALGVLLKTYWHKVVNFLGLGG